MGEARYDAVAEWYDAAVRAGSLTHELVLPAVFDLLGPVAGRKICDLACGQGVAARALARAGARVTGIDISAVLLAIARREEAAEPLGITYLQADAQASAAVAEAAFDAVVCNLALMDIPDLEATLRGVRHRLRPGGRFVFSITHPCFQTPLSSWSQAADGAPRLLVGGYFDEGYWISENPNGVRGKVGAYHRQLSTYLNALAAAGLWLDRAIEPRATGVIAERVPGYGVAPAVLVGRCVAGGPPVQPD